MAFGNIGHMLIVKLVWRC